MVNVFLTCKKIDRWSDQNHFTQSFRLYSHSISFLFFTVLVKKRILFILIHFKDEQLLSHHTMVVEKSCISIVKDLQDFQDYIFERYSIAWNKSCIYRTDVRFFPKHNIFFNLNEILRKYNTLLR